MIDSLGNDFFNASVTAFFAVCVLVMGQIIEKIFISPIQRHRKVIGKISYAVTFYANIIPILDNDKKIHNKQELDDVYKHLRDLGASLRSGRYSIPFYKFFALRGVVPSIENVKKASSSLIGWANTIYEVNDRNIYEFRTEISEALGFDVE